ncbi:MAG: ferritin-like domain-containing protein [Acidimicrobiia bacterium]
MVDFLSQYSIQRWLEMCPQGYLDDTIDGHDPGLTEPEDVLGNEAMREAAIKTTVQLIAGERCALAASSGLVNLAPDYGSKTFLATQVLDEARHVEIFTNRLYDLGVKKADLESTIAQFANPNLVKFAETLLEKIDGGDFLAGVVGQNIVLEGMAFSVFEMLQATSKDPNPKFAQTLAGTIADERRHVGFGENRIGGLIAQHPERKSDIERMQAEMSYHMLATFSDTFRGDGGTSNTYAQEASSRAGSSSVEWQGTQLSTASPAELEALLANTVLGEFKTRLGRIGLDYQSPSLPV